MQGRLLFKSVLLVIFTTYVALALQDLNDPYPKQLKEPQQQDASQASRPVPQLREKRAYYKRKPGFFRTLFSVVFEQWSDTKNTFNKINNMINDNFLPENAPIIEATTASSSLNVSTTTPQYKIKRSEFNKIIQRNLRGLVRLFNIELQDALKQSKRNYAEHKRNVSREVSKFL